MPVPSHVDDCTGLQIAHAYVGSLHLLRFAFARTRARCAANFANFRRRSIARRAANLANFRRRSVTPHRPICQLPQHNRTFSGALGVPLRRQGSSPERDSGSCLRRSTPCSPPPPGIPSNERFSAGAASYRSGNAGNAINPGEFCLHERPSYRPYAEPGAAAAPDRRQRP